MRCRFFLPFVVLFASIPARAQDFYLKGGETIVFLGDSITQNGGYVERIEAFLAARFPDKAFKIVYAGLSSETVSGTSEPDHDPRRPCVQDRFDRDCVPHKPDVVVICYGMNDGNYHPFDEERFRLFQSGMQRLIDRVKKETTARITLVTPPPFDPYRRGVGDPNATHYGYKFPAIDYDQVLEKYSEWLRTLHGKDGIVVADVHTALNEHLKRRRKEKASYYLAGDAVHPGDEGHALMALEILKAWKAPGLERALELPSGSVPAETLELVRKRRHEKSKATEIAFKIEELGNAVPVCPWMGVNIHFVGAPERDLDLIRNAGFGRVRMDFTWESVERKPGVYAFGEYDELLAGLEKRGMKALFILDYSNKLYEEAQSVRTPAGRAAFARFAAAAATHYKSRGVWWEIWNEPNLDQFWKPEPSARDYAALLSEAARAIRAADPEARVLGPATSGFPWEFLETILQKGELDGLTAVSVHPYRGSAPETVIDDYARLRQLLRLHGHQALGLRPFPLVSSEWGYSTVHHGGQRIGEDRQAAYLARLMLVNAAQEIDLSIWYDASNDGADPKETEHNFGLVTQDRKPKPAYLAARTLAAMAGGSPVSGRLRSAPDVHLVELVGGTAVWTSGDPRKVGFRLAAKDAKARVTSLLGELKTLDVKNGIFTVEATDSPQYVAFFDAKSQRISATSTYSLGLEVHSSSIGVTHYRSGPGSETGALSVEIGSGDARTKVAHNPTLEQGRLWPISFPVTWVPTEPTRVQVTLRDESDQIELASLPRVGYASLKPFAPPWPTPDFEPSQLKASVDGDPKVAGEALLVATTTGELGRKGEPALRLEYRFGKGHKFAQVIPAKELSEIPGKPRSFSFWVKGDGLGNLLRIRFRDAKGETFQPTAGAVEWIGWRRVTIPLDGSEAKIWGGGEDGKVDYPIAWDSLFLVDSRREECEGSIEVSSALLVYGMESP